MRETALSKAVVAAIARLIDARHMLAGRGSAGGRDGDEQRAAALREVTGAVDDLRAALNAERQTQVTHSEAIERVCTLQESVAEQLLQHRVPTDCICSERRMAFRNSGVAIAFIEQATKNALRAAVARARGRAARRLVAEASAEVARYATEMRRLVRPRGELP